MTTHEGNSKRYQQLLQALATCIEEGREPFIDNEDSNRRKERREITDERVRDIHGVMSNLLSNLNRDRNHYAPISRLVPELFLEIFSYLNLQDRISVSRVSHSWRELALGATSLWTDINIECFSIRKLQTLIARSGTSPLRITANVKRPERQAMPPLREVWSSPLHMSYPLTRRSLPLSRMKGGGKKSMQCFGQKEFDEIVGRAEYLNVVVGSTKAYYFSPKMLEMEMPFLHTLKLIEDSRIHLFAHTPTPSDESSTPKEEEKQVKGHFFGGVTPRLRAVSFDFIHAPWSDPLYKNLTRLRIGTPSVRITLYEILVILMRCPLLEQLELNEALSAPLFPVDNTPQDIPPYSGPDSVQVSTVVKKLGLEEEGVRLERMKSLVIDESDPYALSHLLNCISLPVLHLLSLHTPDSSCLTDQHFRGQPFASIIPTLSKTKNLQITGGMNHLTVVGSLSSDALPSHSSPKPVIGTWSYLCRPKNRHLSAFAVTGGLGQLPLGSPPPPPPPVIHAAQQPVHPYLPGQPQWPPSTGICDPLQFLHLAERSGVNYAQVEKLEVGGTLDDVFYRDVLGRCANVKSLRLMSHRGMGILADIIGMKLCRNLEEVQMMKFDGTAGALADWVARRKEANIGMKKVVVQLSDSTGTLQHHHAQTPSTLNAGLDEESRLCIEDALGEGGKLVWKDVKRSSSIWGMPGHFVDLMDESTGDWETLVSGGSASEASEDEEGTERWFGDGILEPIVW